MAHLRQCRICKGHILNREMHEECEIASLQDLLSRIQGHLKNKPKKPLPDKLMKEVLLGRFSTLEEVKKSRFEKNDRQSQKKLWELARTEAAQNLIRKWEEDNPDPDPVHY